MGSCPRFLVAFALVAALPAHGALRVEVATTSVNAVQKVVQMLTDMSSKAMEEKKAEQISFAQFEEFCGNQQASLQKQIEEETLEIESKSAESEKLASDVTELGQAIAGLQADVESFSSDKKAQAEQRAKDRKEFLAEQQDYAESIDALERAISVLQKQSYDRTALLQLSESSQLPAKAQEMIGAFLGMMNDDDASAKGTDPLSYEAPEANAYEFQSTNIVELLKGLRSDFVAKKAQLEKEEMNSQHAHDMIVQDLTRSLEKATEEIGRKTSVKQRKQETSSQLTKEVASAAEVKASDEKALSDLKTECAEKRMSFQEKQQLRSEEIEALEKAVEILSDDSVMGSAGKHLALRQAGTALLQYGSLDSADSISQGVHHRVRDFLAAAGKRLHSQRLGLLAEKLAADPFLKVKKLIDDMITRLLEEANQDADHEGFCDKEMETSKITRNKLSEDIDGLMASVESGKATITMLGNDVARLTSEVSNLDVAMQEATAMRTDEKAKNEATAKDAKEALKALEAATAVLKDFYKKASTATAFLQVSGDFDVEKDVKMGSEEWDSLATPKAGTVDKGHKEGMQTFGEQYLGQQDEAGGVLAMLEVIASDFATLRADTESSESLSAKQYKDFMAESKKGKATKLKKIELSSADKANAEAKLREDTEDLKFTQDKLLAADRYYEKLAPQCIDKGMTFEERAKA
eukprot:CAMPEP_0170623870 /NCGR_PEP_ID=MMETSP0224-20130122/29931_1 /TAXON_ID=285029 /ORGANISM="Togula jolla, Strain CCCM 725" /LENGTH=693 /DNA_ID=CAMNT_0010950357 /DNA_START=56 /DNA_END=2133 /DNA_ORIENTATION=-